MIYTKASNAYTNALIYCPTKRGSVCKRESSSFYRVNICLVDEVPMFPMEAIPIIVYAIILLNTFLHI